MASIELGIKNYSTSFYYYYSNNESPFSPVVRYLYPFVSTTAGSSILFAGFETQPNTPSKYTNTSIHIYQWSNGKLVETTSKVLPNNTNRVEGVGDVTFGDFNNDGYSDIYLSAYTDMNHKVNSYALINTAGVYKKIVTGNAAWQHGVASGDINRDGYIDVFSTGYENPTAVYLGGKSGLKEYKLVSNLYNTYSGHGSGVALADFLGNGSLQALIVDSAIANNSNDTGLFEFKFSKNIPIGLEKISTLPTPRIDLKKWSDVQNGESHDIRAKPFEFTNDNLIDALVISAGSISDGRLSEVQFLKNIGKGNFIDVTDSVLVGYNNKSGSAYNPIFSDFDKDGLGDIFLSEADWQVKNNSTTILIQTSKGQFIDSGREIFSKLLSSNGGTIATISLSDDGQYYLVADEYIFSEGKMVTNVFYSKIIFPWRDKSETINHSKSIKSVEVFGLGGNDVITGSNKKDVIKGDDGNDTLNGGADKAADIIDGGAGTDTISFTSIIGTTGVTFALGTCNVINNATTQTVAKIGSTSTDKISNVENITGSSYADTLTGNSAANMLNGGAGEDTLKGSSGTDTLNGGLGNDSLIGGTGSDLFVFNSTPNSTSNRDTITDFNVIDDTIQLENSVFTALGSRTGTLNAAMFKTGNNNNAGDASDRIIYNQSSGALFYDADGTGVAGTVQIALIGNHANLTVADFVVI